MSTDIDIEAITRSRLRSLRQSAGWSLDDLAARSHLSASTISRIETGKRTISLDVLLALAHALQADIGSLLDVRRDDDDVVIRPIPSNRSGSTVWPLSKPSSRTAVTKMRLEPTAVPREIKVHPGDDCPLGPCAPAAWRSRHRRRCGRGGRVLNDDAPRLRRDRRAGRAHHGVRRREPSRPHPHGRGLRGRASGTTTNDASASSLRPGPRSRTRACLGC
jgi:transcriptional regulator with XRE-family HTH domain